ncbi:alpha/beta hydrolase family esterase [Aeromicrobium sp. CTD01-1L150]|uniref:alpha/beta hydrolase family esterase n=1 Tax=Aeromicrobium sp. CTD01-1L150 TaxID=3341830 RepID=UPI0035C0DF5B
MSRVALALVAGCLVLAACTGPQTPPEEPTTPPAAEVCSGQSQQELIVGGQPRSHLVSAPDEWDGESQLPVVYFFHGLGGQADTALAYTGLAERVDELGFVVIAPQAIHTGSRWDYRTAVDEQGSDLAYIHELMDTMSETDCIDADRQYVTGLSNGSALAFAMACSGEFPAQAYGGVAASLYDPECDSAPPASIVYFHGTADLVVPFNGGDTPLEPVAPASQSLTRWAEHAGCDAQADTEAIGDDVELFRWPSCGDHPVHAYVIDGGGHTWPGATPFDGLGETTQTVDASDVMLEFFGLTE